MCIYLATANVTHITDYWFGPANILDVALKHLGKLDCIERVDCFLMKCRSMQNKAIANVDAAVAAIVVVVIKTEKHDTKASK